VEAREMEAEAREMEGQMEGEALAAWQLQPALVAACVSDSEKNPWNVVVVSPIFFLFRDWAFFFKWLGFKSRFYWVPHPIPTAQNAICCETSH